MPLSDISRCSNFGTRFGNGPKAIAAAAHAKQAARREMSIRVRNGTSTRTDPVSFKREYENIYFQEYYKFYANILEQDQQSRIVYLEKPNASRYPSKHTVANFNKANYFVQVHEGCITVGRVNYPLDAEQSPETMEAFLSSWPGPLDRQDERVKEQVTRYTDTLWQHDLERRVRYCNSSNDEQRKTILKLLIELLHRNGSIDAPSITRLLLKPEQTAIQKDESNKKPLETLQKYLLLGQRNEAVKFAKKHKLWDHAQCLAFLGKYQPGADAPSYQKDTHKLKDDTIVQLNLEYVNSLGTGTLQTVYRSLLSKILQGDPESANIIKNHQVGSNTYEFALLSANDCDMEFDQTNEIFKLVIATKQSKINPNLASGHLISLGHSSLDNYDPRDDLSYLSHISFRQVDTPSSRTLTISSIDLLVLNEIWEYCLNLARGTSKNGPAYYNYIANLIPYKLVFASKLLDFGLYGMFAKYLDSLEMALYKVRTEGTHELDPFYDWDTIETCVRFLRNMWDEVFCKCPEMSSYQTANTDSVKPSLYQSTRAISETNPTNPIQPNLYEPQPPQLVAYPNAQSTNNNDFQPDNVDPVHNDFSIPYQHESAYPSMQGYQSQPKYIPPPTFNQRPIQEETAMDSNHEIEAQSPQMEDRNPYEPQMTSSSPVDKRRDSNLSNNRESFGNPFSPINAYDDLPRPIQEPEPYHQQPPPLLPPPPPQMAPRPSDNMTSPPGGSASMGGSSSNNISKPSNMADKSGENKSSQPSGDQQVGFLSGLVGTAKSLLPKSNSKQMILPDDNQKSIVFDDKRGTWIDTSAPEGSDASNTFDAPPVMNVSSQPSYKFNAKKASARYPRA